MKIKAGQVWETKGKYLNVFEITKVSESGVNYIYNNGMSMSFTQLDVMEDHLKQFKFKLDLLKTFKNLKKAKYDQA